MAVAASAAFAAFDEWREATRLLHLVPPDAPERPELETQLAAMRALYERLTRHTVPSTDAALRLQRARIAQTRALLTAIAGRYGIRVPDGPGNDGKSNRAHAVAAEPAIFAAAPTPRELAIVAAIVRGGEKGAAHELGISPNTVRNIVFALRHRVGVATTLQLVAALDDALPGWRPRLTLPGG